MSDQNNSTPYAPIAASADRLAQIDSATFLWEVLAKNLLAAPINDERGSLRRVWFHKLAGRLVIEGYANSIHALHLGQGDGRRLAIELLKVAIALVAVNPHQPEWNSTNRYVELLACLNRENATSSAMRSALARNLKEEIMSNKKAQPDSDPFAATLFPQYTKPINAILTIGRQIFCFSQNVWPNPSERWTPNRDQEFDRLIEELIRRLDSARDGVSPLVPLDSTAFGQWESRVNAFHKAHVAILRRCVAGRGNGMTAELLNEASQSHTALQSACGQFLLPPVRGEGTSPKGSQSVRSKASTNRGDAQVKLVGALLTHHKYQNGSCLNLEPIGNNSLAQMAEVSKSTAKAFFDDQFGGLKKYRVLCRDTRSLVAAIKLLNREYSPQLLYGRTPDGEQEQSDRDDD